MSIKKITIILFLSLIFIYTLLFLGLYNRQIIFLSSVSTGVFFVWQWTLPSPLILFPIVIVVPIIIALTKKWRIFWSYSAFLLGITLLYSLLLIFSSIPFASKITKEFYSRTKFEQSLIQNKLPDINDKSFKNDLNKINAVSGDTPLLAALQSEKCETANFLISQGADINIKRQGSGDNPLILASIYCPDVVKILIQKGANVNDPDNYGTTALITASGRGHLEIVKLLVQNGADVNQKDSYGRSALLFATDNKHLSIVNYLKEMGAE